MSGLKNEAASIGTVAVLDVRPGDVLVLKSARHINLEMRARIEEYVKQTFGADIKVMVLDPDFSLDVVRQAS